MLFAKQNNTVFIEARVVFNPSGVPVLDQTFSKGICAVHSESITFTGSTVNSSLTMGTVSSFAGVFTGMTVTGSTGALQASSEVIDTLTNLTLNLNKFPLVSSDLVTLTASGGRYRFSFGTQENVRLDAYNKLLYTQVSWDETTSSSVGNATSIALSPSAPQMFVVDNKISIKTVPPTLATNSTDCSIAVQFGFTTSSGIGDAAVNRFVAGNPSTGESCRVLFVLGNSTAP